MNTKRVIQNEILFINIRVIIWNLQFIQLVFPILALIAETHLCACHFILSAFTTQHGASRFTVTEPQLGNSSRNWWQVCSNRLLIVIHNFPTKVIRLGQDWNGHVWTLPDLCNVMTALNFRWSADRIGGSSSDSARSITYRCHRRDGMSLTCFGCDLQ